MKVKKIALEKGSKLSLTNSGTLEAFWIGTGSAFAKKHNQTNLLLIKGDTHILVDFGMTGPRALKETAGLDPTDIGVLLPTHSHADHVGGVECLGLMNRYVGIPLMKKPKLTVIINELYQEILWDRTLRGGMEWNEETEATHKLLTFPDFFNVVRPQWLRQQPREVWKINYHGIDMELFRTKHIPDTAPDWQGSFFSIGLFVDNRIFISMDTRFDTELIGLYADRSEIMFHDVQFHPEGVHAPLSSLRTLHPIIKSKMYLMHYPDAFDTQDIYGFAGWTEQGVRYVFES